MRRRRDTTLTFASLHNLLALIATGEIDAAWELVDALATSAAQAEGDQGQVMEAVGIELATTLLDLGLNRAPRSDFASLASRLPRLGGSHAQRDVFVRTLAEFAANRGDSDALRTILGLRRRLKRDDRVVTLLEDRLAGARRRNWRRHSQRAWRRETTDISGEARLPAFCGPQERFPLQER